MLPTPQSSPAHPIQAPWVKVCSQGHGPAVIADTLPCLQLPALPLPLACEDVLEHLAQSEGPRAERGPWSAATKAAGGEARAVEQAPASVQQSHTRLATTSCGAGAWREGPGQWQGGQEKWGQGTLQAVWWLNYHVYLCPPTPPPPLTHPKSGPFYPDCLPPGLRHPHLPASSPACTRAGVHACPLDRQQPARPPASPGR